MDDHCKLLSGPRCHGDFAALDSDPLGIEDGLRAKNFGEGCALIAYYCAFKAARVEPIVLIMSGVSDLSRDAPIAKAVATRGRPFRDKLLG